MEQQEPAFWTILAFDMVGSSRADRDDGMRQELDRTLQRILETALVGSGVAHGTWGEQHTGDGRLVVLPATQPIVPLVDRFPHELDAGLRRHNRTASDAFRIRLRVALHHGLLTPRDRFVWTGAALVTAARLLDSGPPRELLAAAPGLDHALVLSREAFQLLRSQPFDRLELQRFRRVETSVKEHREFAWLFVPQGAEPPAGVRGSDTATEGDDTSAGRPHRTGRTAPVSVTSSVQQQGGAFNLATGSGDIRDLGGINLAGAQLSGGPVQLPEDTAEVDEDPEGRAHR